MCEYPGRFGLLRDSEHKDNDARMGRMATPPFPDVHMEAMEETQNESEEPDDTGNAGVASLPERKHKEGILGGCRKWDTHPHNNKQKTRTSRILQYP